VATPVYTKAQIEASVAVLQTEVLALLNHQPLSGDAPFLGNFTLDEYHALPEAEKAQLWDEWAGDDLLALDEQEVEPNALPAYSSSREASLPRDLVVHLVRFAPNLK
jgi:hypothetical protein